MPIETPIHTNEANLPRVLNAGLPVLLVFWRRECAPCEQLNTTLDRLAKAYAGRALIAKINVSDEPGATQRYGIERLPTVLLFKEGHLVARGVGAAGEPELAAWLSYLTRGGPQPAVPT
ncbi:MAG: thioredoxin family protein, partial [Anaerolineae bacterium]